MFTGCSEGVFFSGGYQNSMFEHTLSHCQDLAMRSHDVRYALAMRAMCGLCVRYVGATRAMRVRHAGDVGVYVRSVGVCVA